MTDLKAYAAQLVAQFGHRLGNPDWDIIVEHRDEGEELTDAEVDEVHRLWRTAEVSVSWPEQRPDDGPAPVPPPAMAATAEGAPTSDETTDFVIPAEAVEAVALAYLDHRSGGSRVELHPVLERGVQIEARKFARAALEAAHPHLRAQGRAKSDQICGDCSALPGRDHSPSCLTNLEGVKALAETATAIGHALGRAEGRKEALEQNARRCWCDAEVGPRVPGDAQGLGCLGDIMHIWRPVARYEPCLSASEWGECVLAAGHETHESGDVGAEPTTSHVDRWGHHWGVVR